MGSAGFYGEGEPELGGREKGSDDTVTNACCTCSTKQPSGTSTSQLNWEQW